MDISAEFLDAAVPEPVTLLGQKLKPYSVGHEIILRKIESPFLVEGMVDKFDDLDGALYVAVLVCMNTFDDATAELNKDTMPEMFSKWRKKMGNYELAPMIDKFTKYLSEGSKIPQFSLRETDKGISSRPGAPIHASLLTTLMEGLNMSCAEAMNCSLRMAYWLYLTYWERHGMFIIGNYGIDSSLKAAIRAKAMEMGLVLVNRDKLERN